VSDVLEERSPYVRCEVQDRSPRCLAVTHTDMAVGKVGDLHTLPVAYAEGTLPPAPFKGFGVALVHQAYLPLAAISDLHPFCAQGRCISSLML
jgi:hypothetical protein